MQTEFEPERPEDVRLSAVAHALGVPLDGRQRQQLMLFLTLLAKWNARYNLTAVREREAMLTQHLFDCLAAVAPIRRQLKGREGPKLLDVGSGAGLPGIVIAVAAPEVAVTCVDAVAKKAAFVREVARELRLSALQSVHARVERWGKAEFDIAASRAFGTLAKQAELTSHLLADDGVWMSMKATPPQDEIAALPPSLEVFHVEQLVVPGLAARRCLVWFRRRGT